MKHYKYINQILYAYIIDIDIIFSLYKVDLFILHLFLYSSRLIYLSIYPYLYKNFHKVSIFKVVDIYLAN